MTAPLLMPEIHRGVEDLVRRTLEEDRIDAPKPIRLHDRDLDLLQILSELRYLTGPMLGVFAWGSYHSRFRNRLYAIFNAGLVRRFRPPARGGPNHWVYELTQAGYRALRDRRADLSSHWRPAELHSFAYAEHDLELNAVLCELAARAAAHVGGAGALLNAAPFSILGPRTGRIDPSHEARPISAATTNELPAGHIVRPGKSQLGLLEPDASLIGNEATTGEPIAILLEYDRSRRAHKLIAKLPRYDAFLADGWRRTRYASLPGEPAVLFVVRDEAQVQQVLREADYALTAWTGPGGADDIRGRFPGREELAVTSRAALLRGDDTVFQVDHSPSEISTPRPAVLRPLKTYLPLSRLFRPPPELGQVKRSAPVI